MKFFLAILTIAMVAHVCLGASIQRSKRDVDVITPLKDFFLESKSIVANVIEDVPDDDAYAVYKQPYVELLELLNEVDDFMCAEKVMAIFENIMEINKQITEDKSEEAKEIWQLYIKHSNPHYGIKMTNVGLMLQGPNNIETLEQCATD